jgi:hypothetical protein
LQYEQVPHFCFSCGRLGHSELLCPTLSSRNDNGEWPFGAGLRAPDDRKKSGSFENSPREHFASHNSKRETKFSSNVPDARAEVTSPSNTAGGVKRKGDGTRKVYRPVGLLQPSEPAIARPSADNQLMLVPLHGAGEGGNQQMVPASEGDQNKKRKTPSVTENLAEAVRQPCNELSWLERSGAWEPRNHL